MCPKCNGLMIGWSEWPDHSRARPRTTLEYPLNKTFIPTKRLYDCLNPQCGHKWQDPPPRKEKD